MFRNVERSNRPVLAKIKKGLKKTRENVFSKLGNVFSAHNKIDEDLLEEIEEILITGDVGVDTTLEIIDHLRDQIKKRKIESPQEIQQVLKEELSKQLLAPPETVVEQKPYVILVVGVNGTGKTTSIAKLANHYQKQGKKVLLAAADTFRAAAIEQLEIWAQRLGCDIIKHQPGADPAAVVFDTLAAAKARGVDYVIIDTAGRLHTKVNLMSELNKIYRVIDKQVPGAPHEVILVIDAGNGQNAINQAREFVKAVKVNAIFLTKLDGTAKGGVVLSIKRRLGIPVKYIGLGEQMDDFELFNPQEFLEGLFAKE
ncbi:MAG: signal recognition particle-docking protein FtsY [Caldisericaceae bacterium]|nr:signal recognition particle-docking protein FtsY [Caldisericaceae bacterium]